MPLPVDSPIHIASAALVSRGAAVQVLLEGTAPSVNCDAAIGFGVSAVISQRVGHTTTQSSASADACASDAFVISDNGAFKIMLLLPVQPRLKLFRAHRAYLQATLARCQIVYGCNYTTVESIMKLADKSTT